MSHLPVLLTFDLDDELSTRNAVKDPSSGISDPELGRFGLTEGYRNVLDILNERNIRGSFFVVGSSVERYPKAIEQIISLGHEIANHSFSHTSYLKLSADQLFDEVAKTNDILFSISGQRPVGHRSPYWHESPHLSEVLAKLGFSWNGDAHTKVGEESALKLSWRGPSILEVPSSSYQGDWNNFLVRKKSPEEVYDTWCSRLDLARAQSDVFTLVCHPFIIGQARYIETLAKFIDHVLSRQGEFRFLTGSELVSEKSRQKASS